MAKQEEVAATLREAVTQLDKSNAEVKGALGSLTAKISELEAAVAAGGDASPELLDAVAAVKAAAQAADDLVPDAPAPTPTE